MGGASFLFENPRRGVSQERGGGGGGGRGGPRIFGRGGLNISLGGGRNAHQDMVPF